MTTHALVFTDLVDSTKLVERLGDERAAQTWAEHDRRARELLAEHGGREIDRSDGFFLLFDEALAAARFALDYHAAMAALDLSARIGIHVGAVTLRDNAPADIARGAKRVEVEGLAKPYAARIMALARGGQTLLSTRAREALGGLLPERVVVDHHGHYRLKGIDEPVEIFELGARGSAFVPPADTDKVHRVVRTGELWSPVRNVRHNLIAERDAFIGRAAELRTLARQLDSGTRLLTILGPGGAGKTRLARRYARAWLGDWPAGVYFCDLSEARSLDGVHFAVALALGVPLGSGDHALQLGHAIAGRGRCLVILDNFEQVLQHAPATVGRWLDLAAETAFVVTSRERLHLRGEELFSLEPLGLADEAIELFEARARAQRPAFALDDANRAAVAEAVRLLDGLPLAIELAAARMRVLSPAQLVERLRDRFQVLAGARGAAARQATLKGAIEWSWQLLTTWEQAALAQCSVFEGGFTLAAAEAVLDLSPWPDAPQAIDAVQSLVDKSLLRSWMRAPSPRLDIDEPYFGMYISIHEFAAQQLRSGAADQQSAAEQRHGRHFASFGSESAIGALFRHGGVQRRHALMLELDNLVATCRRATLRGDAGVAVASFRATWMVLELQGPFALGAELGRQVMAIETLAPAERALTNNILSRAYHRIGRKEDAAACLDQALSLSLAIGDRHGEGMALGALGLQDTFQGRPEQGIPRSQAALAIHRELGNRRMEGAALSALAVQFHDLGRIEEAQQHYEASLAVHRELGDRLAQGIVLGNLGTLHNDLGRLREAREHYTEAIVICREVGDRHGEGVTLGNLGKLDMDEGRIADALRDHELALRTVREVGSRRDEGIVIGQLGGVHQARGEMDAARACYEQALAIAREVGNRRFEAEALTNLGDLLITRSCPAEALDVLDAGETLLREINDPMDLAKLLCIRGRAEVALGNLPAARAALAEAEDAVAALGAERSSAVWKEIERLQQALDPGP
jgi:predicted ATPase/class 3 adenylate cyclase/Tfp pilus assembly protein PilF